ncbi:MAG: hypothetical protein JKY61_06880, partial [Planctomycetes bacterium]|nr:hypothetical protein [Planctomycetota bacterium]
MHHFIKRNMLFAWVAVLGFCFASPQAFAIQSGQDHTGHNHAPGEGHGDTGVRRTFEYSPEVLDAWARVPIQEGGRIKPLDTMAGFKLLRYNGKRGIKTEDLSPEGKLVPIAWLLDCIFFPEQAREYACFVVDLKAVTVALGLDLEDKKKRDRYSYNELLTVRQSLMLKAQEASRKESAERDTIERQILNLSRNFLELEDLLRLSEFAGVKLPVSTVPELSELFSGEDPELPLWLARSVEIKARVPRALVSQEPGSNVDAGWRAIIGTLEQLRHRSYGGLALFAPTSGPEAVPAWYTWPEMVEACLQGNGDAMDNLPALEAIGATFKSRQDEAQFSAQALATAKLLQARAEARGEFSRVPMEVSFYKFDFFYKALYAFILAFLLTAIAWLRSNKSGGGAGVVKGAWVMNVAGLALLVGGITYRC